MLSVLKLPILQYNSLTKEGEYIYFSVSFTISIFIEEEKTRVKKAKKINIAS